MTGSRYRILAAALAVVLAMVLVLAGLGMSAGAGCTLVVTTAADLGSPCPSRPAPSGRLSLRCAILRANQDRSGDTISFKIPFLDRGCRTAPPSSPPAGSKRRTVCTIKPTRQLPSLRAGHTIIDGYTQPGSKPNTNLLRAGDNAILTVWLDGSANLISGNRLEGIFVYDGCATIRVVAGQRVTATATTPASPGPRETSEFAANVAVTTASD